jgi:hypothetical protein
MENIKVSADSVEMKPGQEDIGVHPELSFLLPALRRLDQLLEWAAKSLHSDGRTETESPFRGLYVSRDDVARLLSQEPCASPFRTGQEALEDSFDELTPKGSPLAWLIRTFGLSSFDADLILIALAPEVDLRYEKIYAYLQDDITRKRPTVELALNLLCPSVGTKLDRRLHLSPSSPLIRHGLLQVIPDPNQVEPTYLAHYLVLDDMITRLLLGQPGLDPRLVSFSELIEPSSDREKRRLGGDVEQALLGLVRQALAAHRPLRFYFQGPSGGDKREAAKDLAAAVGAKLIVARVDQLPEKSETNLLWKLLLREAWINDAIIYISELEDFRGQDPSSRRQELLDPVANYSGVTILAGRLPWAPSDTAPIGILTIAFEIPDFRTRSARWQIELANSGVAADAKDIETVAGRFRLTTAQIAQAVKTASLNSQWHAALRSPGDRGSIHSALPTPTLDELAAAARIQCGYELAGLASKIEPRYGWDDIVLPADEVAQLHEICSQAQYRNVVYGDWGFDRKLSLGKGLNVLFSGPPGTGKTMAAEVIARELRQDLYRIDLPQTISKYIGETEKNLDRVFTAAENSNAILFFDEADALFGKRSEVRDSHDRYANIEISYLLQKMEQYQGISILATNLRQNLDEAFVRRLQAIVEFPFPDEEYRRRIWEAVFPKEAPLGEDVKFDLLAREVRLAGGNIKSMALAAAFYAAVAHDSVRMEHLIQAAHREHQKLGRSWSSSGKMEMAKPSTH